MYLGIKHLCLVIGFILVGSLEALDSLRADVELPAKEIVQKGFIDYSNEAYVVIHKSSWQGTGKSLAGIIQEHSGIQSRKYGGLGSFQTVSMRGVPGSKITVMMDNILLNSAGGGAVDLGKINISTIEKIVVYKGITPGRFGGNSLGGFIHLITKPAQKKHITTEMSYGSFNTQKMNGKIVLPLGAKLKASSQINYAHSDNSFKYLDRNNTPYNKEDDVYRKLQNGKFKNIEGTHRLRMTEKNHQAGIHFYHANPMGGIPGQEGHVTESSGFKTPIQHLSGNYHSNHWENKGLTFDMNVSLRKEAPRYFWTDQDNLTWSMGNDTVDIGNINYSYLTSLNSHYKYKALFDLDGGVIGNYQTLDPKVYNGHGKEMSWSNNRTTHALITELKTFPFSQNSSLIFGYRLERVENNSEGGIEFNGQEYHPEQKLNYQNAYRTGGQWILGKSANPLKIFTNVGRYYKLPSLTELYGGKWGMLPNPELEPETGWNSELGLQNKFMVGGGKHSGEVVIFRNINKATIYYVQSAQLLKPLNINSSENFGLEFNLSLFQNSWIGLDNQMTWQRPYNTSGLVYQGKLTPNQPLFSNVSNIQFKLGRKLTTTYTFDFNSKKYRDQANLQEIPPQLLQHLKIHYQLSQSLWFVFSAENLTDEFYENAYSSYPYPGRQMHFSLGYNY